ncbi:receptor-like cytosolic serine/threonine-protein kinase RBK2 [Senna tora]|uniref:non-specific serine/threonine protein kinase n=1 Tax=Senna tora TaxID=362788 RepID=A0A834T4L5_9FABA|nr:receptor-like cytosolic serine/threonine-protein kinase RBK2 [Senna tora]
MHTILDLRGLDSVEQHIPSDQCCTRGGRELEECSSSTEPRSPSSRASTSDSETQSNNNQWHTFFRLLKKGPRMRFQPFYPLKSVPKLTRRKSKRFREDQIPIIGSSSPLKAAIDADLYCFKASWINFSFADILSATNSFSQENLIGQGGYAEVYKGKMEDGKFVAIKRLTRGTQEEMTADFLSELGIIVHVDHPNIARLIGYGVEGGMFLVLQLSPHGSLASILYGPREKLDWSIRFKVAVGSADGLRYLHEECPRRIIHRDIKAANILLSEDFEAMISDFGLSKWLPDQWTHHTISKIEGTFGYLPPEFFMYGLVDEKTDVYAYGAKPLLSTNNIKELVDPCLHNAYDEEQMNLIAFVASLCIDQAAVQRPHMSQVLKILKGEEDCLGRMKMRQKSKIQRTYSEELLDAEEYNSTKFLNEVDRHMETLLGNCNSSEE